MMTTTTGDDDASNSEESDDEPDEMDDDGNAAEDITIADQLAKIRQNKKPVTASGSYKQLRNLFDFDPYNVIEPPPPDEPEYEPLPPIELAGISLGGIMWSENNRQAMITGEDGKGYFVTVGDRVKGVTIEDIQPDRVIFVQRVGPQVQRAILELKKEED